MAETLRELVERVPQVGRVEWIGVRPERAAPMRVLDAVLALEGRGLEGDRAAARRGGKRQVTLIQAEHLEVIAGWMRTDAIDPALVRRNLVIRGINLHALSHRRFRVGECELEGTGDCHPCSKMEAALGDGGYAALRGHGGITARVVREGRIAIGDEVVAFQASGAEGSRESRL